MIDLIFNFFTENPLLLILIIPAIFVLHFVFKGIKFIFKIIFYIILAAAIIYFLKDFFI